MTLKELEVIAALDGKEIQKSDICRWEKCWEKNGKVQVYEFWYGHILLHRPCNKHLPYYLSAKGRFWKVVQSQ